MKTVQLIRVTLLAAVALTACSSGSSDGNDVPRDWIRGEYSSSGPYYVDRVARPSAVADEIDGHTSARDRVTGSGSVFLRYAHDIVAVSPYPGGSRIEIDDYRNGHRRWNTYVGHVWPAPGSDDFRGGGPGSGK